MWKRLAAFVALLLPAVVFAQSGAPDSPGRLEVSLKAPNPTTVQVTFRISGEPPEPWVIEREAEAPGKVVIEAPRGSVVETLVAAPGLWAPTVSTYVAKTTETIGVKLLPTGRWIADVTTDLQTWPDSLETRFLWAPDAEDGVAGEHVVECPIEEKRLVCELPAGRLDLRLRRRGLVTLFRWDVTILPHEDHEASPLHLRPGATVFGWMELDSEELEPKKASAELVVDGVLPALDATDRSRSDSMRLEAKVNDRGFYAFPDVPAGDYELVLRHEGFAPGRLDPVIVREGVELELPPVELAPPATLALSVWPPGDPFHVPWRITLTQRGPLSSRTAAEGPLDAEGSFSAEGLEPGEYRLVVADSRGSRWHAETLQVAGDGVHEVEMPYDRLEGLVTLAEEPLPSTLYFGGRNGEERIVIHTNEEGIFYVFLPRRASWFADVHSREGDLTARVDGIVVERRPDEPWAKTEVEVPDTRVYGRVVDDHGTPLDGAQVLVHGPEPEDDGRRRETRQVVTEKDGRFEVRGFQPGVWGLEAKHRAADTGRFASAPLDQVDVADGTPTGPVRLVVREDRTLSGIVVAPNGDGVPGAMVIPALEQGATPISWDIQHQVTEVDGTFTFRIPAAAPAVQLQIYPPGHAARHFRVPLPAEDPVIVPVDAVGGTIVVTPRQPEALDDRSFHIRTALFGEFLYYTPALRLWAGSWGIRETKNVLVFPSMEPGPYTACFDVTPLAIDGGRLPAGVSDRCVSGVLSPGSELRLEVPNPQRPRSTAE